MSVTNTGRRISRDIVQVYLRPTDPEQPVRLVGWQAATAAPGETAVVTVATDPRLWRRWDASTQQWGSLGAGGQLLVARGLGDVRATIELTHRP